MPTQLNDKNLTAFRRMRSKGIPTPPVRVYDRTNRMISQYYDKVLEQVSKLVLEYAEKYNLSVEGKEVSKVTDSAFDLINQVKYLLFGTEQYQNISNKFRHQMTENQKHFFEQMYKYADPKMANFLVKFSLSKEDVFHDRLKDIKEQYIDNAVTRIEGEKDDLKKSFLQKLTDWAEGRSNTLDVGKEMMEMKATAVSQSRFFARDQFGKLNKAMLIATFKEARVKTVELTGVKDKATRPEHRKWQGERYGIDNIPKEWYEAYNCRCGARPVSYYED